MNWKNSLLMLWLFFYGFAAFAQGDFPLTNAVLRGPMNANVQAITNAGDVVLSGGTSLAALGTGTVARADVGLVFEARHSTPFNFSLGLDYMIWDVVSADVYSALSDGTDYVVPLELDGATALITATLVPGASGSSFTPFYFRLMNDTATLYAYYYHTSHDGVIGPSLAETMPTISVSAVVTLIAGNHVWFEGESDSDGGWFEDADADVWQITVIKPKE
jgi:hypothetical protein